MRSSTKQNQYTNSLPRSNRTTNMKNNKMKKRFNKTIQPISSIVQQSPVLYKKKENTNTHIDSETLEQRFENINVLNDDDAMFLFDQHVLETFQQMKTLPTPPKIKRNIWTLKSPRQRRRTPTPSPRSSRTLKQQKAAAFGRTIRSPSLIRQKKTKI